MKYVVQEVPMLSANEEEVTLAVWLRDEGEFVKKGQEIAQVESTKAVEDVNADADGYLFHLVEMGQKVRIGSPFAVIAEDNDSSVKDKIEIKEVKLETEPPGSERKWTKKAAIMAKKHGLDIESIPAVGVTQVADVINFVMHGSRRDEDLAEFDENVYFGKKGERILLLGGGRGAVQVIDAVLRGDRQEIAGILDDNESLHGQKILGIEILGPISMVPELWKQKRFDALAITFSNALEKRAALYEKLVSDGLPFTNIIDRSVQIHANGEIGRGNIIIANCRIGACAVIGNNNFLSAYVNLEHHNVLGSHCTFGPGVFTSSRVQIDDKVKFGTGIFIEPGIKIGSESIISSGSILTLDVPEKSIVKNKLDVKVRPRKF
jgi:sugar O-acyltransferase (sialic acid O-acetyltransferase NeuD family)